MRTGTPVNMKTNESIFLAGLLTLVLLQLSCDSSPTSPETAGLGHFPMQIGNRWTYQSLVDTSWIVDVEITGKRQIGLRRYFVFEERYSGSDQVYRLYFRAGDDGRIFTSRQGQDRLYIDFGRTVGKAWPSFGEYIGQISQRNVSRVVPAGAFENCVIVGWDMPQWVDDELWDTFAPGVGAVVRNSAWTSFVLKSAVVNGIVL